MAMKVEWKRFLWGIATGMVAMLLLEAGVLTTFALWSRRSPAQIAETLQAPPIPATWQADFNIHLKPADAEMEPFATLKGRPIFLAFFNPDCDSCKAELSAIQHLADQVRDTDTAFVLVSHKKDEKAAKRTMHEYEITVPLYVLEGEKPRVYQSSSIPSAFLIDRNGAIAFRHVGPARWNDKAVVDFVHRMAAPTEQ